MFKTLRKYCKANKNLPTEGLQWPTHQPVIQTVIRTGNTFCKSTYCVAYTNIVETSSTAGRDNNILCLLMYSLSGLYQAVLISSEHYYISHYQHLCRQNEEELQEALWTVRYKSLMGVNARDLFPWAQYCRNKCPVTVLWHKSLFHLLYLDCAARGTTEALG
jgi:hypothetical protein